MEAGWYWIKFHSGINSKAEYTWMIGYYSNRKDEWYTHNFEGDCGEYIVEIGSKINNPEEL